MYILIVLTGLLLILFGWLMYRNPNFLNPYGDMSPEMKARVDIDGLKKSACIAINVYGGMLIIAALLFWLQIIGPNVVGIVMGALTLAFVFWVIVAFRKYNGFGRDEKGDGYFNLYMNKAAKITVAIVMVMVVAVAVFLSIYMNRR